MIMTQTVHDTRALKFMFTYSEVCTQKRENLWTINLSAPIHTWLIVTHFQNKNFDDSDQQQDSQGSSNNCVQRVWSMCGTTHLD